MKKLLLLLIISTITAFSCRKPSEAPSLTSIITQGKWYVNLMKDNGVNKTAAYKNWQFIFNSDKTITVTKNAVTYNGTWEEDPLRKKIILNITSPEIELILISQEWDISFKTPGRVTFNDDKLTPTQELQLTKF